MLLAVAAALAAEPEEPAAPDGPDEIDELEPPVLHQARMGIGVTFGGGALPALNFVWYPTKTVAIDLGAGPRWGVGDQLYLNVAGLAGVALDLGERKFHYGAFLRLGATPPGTFAESFGALGFSARWHLGARNLVTFDAGPGYFFARNIPQSVQDQPDFLLYLRVGWDIFFD